LPVLLTGRPTLFSDFAAQFARVAAEQRTATNAIGEADFAVVPSSYYVSTGTRDLVDLSWHEPREMVAGKPTRIRLRRVYVAAMSWGDVSIDKGSIRLVDTGGVSFKRWFAGQQAFERDVLEKARGATATVSMCADLNSGAIPVKAIARLRSGPLVSFAITLTPPSMVTGVQVVSPVLLPELSGEVVVQWPTGLPIPGQEVDLLIKRKRSSGAYLQLTRASPGQALTLPLGDYKVQVDRSSWAAGLLGDVGFSVVEGCNLETTLPVIADNVRAVKLRLEMPSDAPAPDFVVISAKQDGVQVGSFSGAWDEGHTMYLPAGKYELWMKTVRFTLVKQAIAVSHQHGDQEVRVSLQLKEDGRASK
jgi:hypothetical protein